jgi:Ca2+/Na+ antiporter
MKKQTLKLSILLIIWLIIIIAYFIKSYDIKQKIQQQKDNRSEIININKNLIKLKKQQLLLRKKKDKFDKTYILNLEKIQLIIQKIAQNNNLKTIIIEKKKITKLKKSNFKKGIIHFKFLGNYLDFWQFKLDLQTQNLVYSTISEKIIKTQNSDISIDVFLSFLIYQK